MEDHCPEKLRDRLLVLLVGMDLKSARRGFESWILTTRSAMSGNSIVMSMFSHLKNRDGNNAISGIGKITKVLASAQYLIYIRLLTNSSCILIGST